MGLKGSDKPFRSLSLAFLPASIRAWAHDLTYNEVHAAGLGLVGLPLAVIFAAGVVEPVAAFLLGSIAVAFGLRKIDADASIAQRVVRREPWYYTTALVVAFVGTLAVVRLA